MILALSKEDVKSYAELVLAIGAAITLVWHSWNIHTISVKIDGFKTEWDKLQKSNSRKEGILEEKNYQQVRADKKEEKESEKK